MAYKLENFLVQVSGTDRLLKIKESSGIIKHTIDGFSITSLRAVNNIVKINIGNISNNFINSLVSDSVNSSVNNVEQYKNNVKFMDIIKNIDNIKIINDNIIQINNINIILLYDVYNNIWLSYNSLLNALGYKYNAIQKKRLNLDDKYFDSYINLYSQSKLNKINICNFIKTHI